MNIDNRRAAHMQAILREYERVTSSMHPEETAQARLYYRKALYELQARHDASTDREERLDIAKQSCPILDDLSARTR